MEKEQEKAAKQELDLRKLMAENASLKEELSARRQGTTADDMFQNRAIYQSINKKIIY